LNQVLTEQTTETTINASFETFATSPEEFVAIALRGAVQKVGKAVHHLNRQDKIEIIRELELAGVFRFQHAMDIVMQELGVSRASIYAYLKDIRHESEEACDEKQA
jgi:predicted transcriptional regulator YheO